MKSPKRGRNHIRVAFSRADTPPAIQKVLKHSGIGLLRISVKGKVLGIDDGAMTVLDLKPERAKALLGKSLNALFGDAATGREIRKQLDERSDGASFELCVSTLGKKTRWLRITSCCIRGEPGAKTESNQLALVDITEQKQAEERQQNLATGLRTVVHIADSLMGYTDEDAFFRMAVEAARQRLPLERCAIFLSDGAYLQGTYGTDRKGRITDEHFHRFPIPEEWLRRLRSIDPEGVRMMVSEGPYYEVRNRRVIKFGSGRVAFTPILSAHQLLGIFMNDCAITGSPLDPVKQELVSVLCSLLGDILDRMRTESRRQAVSDGLRAVTQVADELIGCPDLETLYRRGVELARKHLAVERCAIFLRDGDTLRGTYGTDRRGKTTREFGHFFPATKSWMSRLQALQAQQKRSLVLEGPYHEWKNGQTVEFGHGWMAVTPIFAGKEFLGVLCNDTAISKRAPDDAVQEVLSVYCSLFGAVVERKRIEEHQRKLSDGLRAVVGIADEMLASADIDTLCLRAVELARAKLHIERCAVFLRDKNVLRGTYGTNLKRETTREHSHTFSAYPDWINHFESLQPADRQMVLKSEPYTEWNGTQPVRFDKGWVAITPIQSSGEVIGVFSNDTAITRKPMDEAQQEILAIFCSMLGALIERKNAEAARLESERHFRETLSNVALIAVTLDMEGKITFCNDFLLNITGWHRDELIGKSWFECMIPKPERKQLLSMFKQLAPEGRFPSHHENDILTRSGELRTASWNNTPLRAPDGTIIGVTSIGEDITERQRALHEIRRLAMVVEQQAEAVIIADTTGAIQYVNPAFERLTGYTRSEALGKNPRILKSGKQSRDFYTAMWRQLSEGTPWSGHFTNRRKDGAAYEVESTISPIRDDSGRIIGFVSTSRDVTHEMQLEQQFRQSQKMEAIGRLAGGIAHDFNNLLTSILGYSRLIKDELPEGSPFTNDLDEVINAGERAAALTRQLLTFSRKQAVQTRPVKLNGVVMDMDKLLRRTLGEDIELVTILDSEMGFANADTGLLEQIIMNLAINARDAMPRGGTLTIQTSTANLNDHFCACHAGVKPGRYVLLSVRDTGMGMSREIYERCFEPFFTTKEKGKGTGLGLSIVYSIVEQLNGFITVDSAPDRGSAFTAYFPAVAAATEKSQAYERIELPRGQETILVVEDEEAVRRLTVRLLESLGYKVLQARHGGEALLICERHEGQIDLVLTDVVMPHIGGQELVQRLMQIRKDFKVLYMSGFTDTAFVSREEGQGKTPLILKPFTNEALARRVRDMLDQK